MHPQTMCLVQTGDFHPPAVGNWLKPEPQIPSLLLQHSVFNMFGSCEKNGRDSLVLVGSQGVEECDDGNSGGIV